MTDAVQFWQGMFNAAHARAESLEATSPRPFTEDEAMEWNHDFAQRLVDRYGLSMEQAWEIGVIALRLLKMEPPEWTQA